MLLKVQTGEIGNEDTGEGERQGGGIIVWAEKGQVQEDSLKKVVDAAFSVLSFTRCGSGISISRTGEAPRPPQESSGGWPWGLRSTGGCPNSHYSSLAQTAGNFFFIIIIRSHDPR